MGKEIELDADLRAKIETVSNDLLADISYDIANGHGLDPRLIESECIRAAALAVEHERELVCGKCGEVHEPRCSRIRSTWRVPHGVKVTSPKTTRAEFERRKEGR